MLWYKGWLETRYRFLFASLFLGFLMLSVHQLGSRPPNPGAKALGGIALLISSFFVVSFSMLAGAGINTQPSLQASKGLHGSTMFTLSLPVKRLHLLSIRAAIGWTEMSLLITLICCLIPL